MDNNNLLLSLCIPTNGIVEWVLPAIESIYAQGVDNSLFEVVVADNGGKTDLKEAVKRFHYSNFHYYKTTSSGFTNQIVAFKKCSGVFCKMLNHRSRMLPGSINKIVALVKMFQERKPILYFADGNIKGDPYIECDSVDSFVTNLGYYVSWSAGAGAWKDDLMYLREEEFNGIFPHTILLFGLRDKSSYVIWNERYEEISDDSGKGGYDLFYTFGVAFLDLINGLRESGRISLNTFIKVKSDLFVFLRMLYLNEVILPANHTFILRNISQSMNVYFGSIYYWKMVFGAWLRFPVVLSRKILSRLY